MLHSWAAAKPRGEGKQRQVTPLRGTPRRPVRILALHGFGGNFGNGQGLEEFCTSLASGLRREGLDVEIIAPQAHSYVEVGSGGAETMRYPAWLAGDQSALGKVAGFYYNDEYRKRHPRSIAPRLDYSHPDKAFAYDLKAEKEIKRMLAEYRAASVSYAENGGATHPLQVKSIIDKNNEYLWKGSEGYLASIEQIRRIWATKGPFDGVLGFSQGSMMALLFVANMMHTPQHDPNGLRGHVCNARGDKLDNSESAGKIRELVPPNFLVLVGAVGIRPWPLEASSSWPRQISVPVLNVIGSHDLCCAPSRSREVAWLVSQKSSNGDAVLYEEYEHDLMEDKIHGGHFVPTTKAFHAKLNNFVARVMFGH
eukprot:CAMPEP_0114487658 /NCGR_PEP_ID=MMETSP0109-20121206/894_1 /TAXON_ID=29199 /ORGANISM="Chlorarachnion reptans, Strain CCCM449" /LENGTH=366 /DNA_ID=CAMNT_0001663959 /DNA_START=125 /DNA_END=1225 /DNA_ORIENTATION=+